MGREAFDREGASHADFLFVFIGFVVEIFVFGLGCDGCVDFFLTGDALLPPLRVEFLGILGPFLISFAGDFPFFPFLADSLIQAFAQGFEGLLEFVPDDVYLDIIRDGFQSDMRDALVNETLADIAVSGAIGMNYG